MDALTPDRFHFVIDTAAGHQPDRPWHRYRVFTRGGRELVRGFAPSEQLATHAAERAVKALEVERVEHNQERARRPRPWRERR